MEKKEINKIRRGFVKRILEEKIKVARFIVYDTSKGWDEIVDIVECTMTPNEGYLPSIISNSKEFAAHIRFFINTHLENGLKVTIEKADYSGKH